MSDLAFLLLLVIGCLAALMWGTRLWPGEKHEEGGMDADDPAGSSHRARSASEAEPALRCEASARGVRRQVTTHEPVQGLRRKNMDDFEFFKGVTRSIGEGDADIKDPSDGFIEAMLAAIQVDRGNAGPFREQLEPGSAHLTVSGRFQSDKYPWCAAGFVPIKTSDPMAQDLLRKYAKRRAAVDKDFCADLLAALPHDPHYGAE